MNSSSQSLEKASEAIKLHRPIRRNHLFNELKTLIHPKMHRSDGKSRGRTLTIENVQDMAKKMAIKTRAVLNYLNVAIVVTFLVIFHQFFALENGGSQQGKQEIRQIQKT